MDDSSLAKFIAELINGGDWNDPQWYTEEQKRLWYGHAEAIMSFIHSNSHESSDLTFRLTKN